MSKKEMSRKLNKMAVMSMIIMVICTAIVGIGVFMYLCNYECVTLIIVGTTLWITGFLTYYIIVYDNKSDDI